MFNFMKKGVGVGERDREKTDRDKDRRKKDKTTKRKDLTKQNILGTMSSEELLRLDEVCFEHFYEYKKTQNVIKNRNSVSSSECLNKLIFYC